MREAGERPAVCLGHQRMQLREAFDVHLVDDRPLPRHFGLARRAPGERGVDDAALLHERCAVALVKGEVLVGVVELVAEQLGPPAQLSDQLLGVGIEQQLVGVEAMSGVGLVGSMNAIAIDRAGAGRRQIAVPDLIGIFRKLDALDFGFTVGVEQA